MNLPSSAKNSWSSRHIKNDTGEGNFLTERPRDMKLTESNNEGFMKIPFWFTQRTDIDIYTKMVVGYVYTRSSEKMESKWTISAIDIVNILGMPKQTVSKIIVVLMDAGILEFIQYLKMPVGRPIKVYGIKRDKLMKWMKTSSIQGTKLVPTVDKRTLSLRGTVQEEEVLRSTSKPGTLSTGALAASAPGGSLGSVNELFDRISRRSSQDHNNSQKANSKTKIPQRADSTTSTISVSRTENNDITVSTVRGVVREGLINGNINKKTLNGFDANARDRMVAAARRYTQQLLDE